MVPRETLQQIDDFESRLAKGYVGISSLAVLTLGIILSIHPLTGSLSTALVKGKCPNPYIFAGKSCVWIDTITFSSASTLMAIIAAGLGGLYWAAHRRRRTPVVFLGFLVGLTLTMLDSPATSFRPFYFIGMGGIAVGAWLMIRAYRLQKYGVAKSREVTALLKERAIARREGRTPPPTSRELAAPVVAASSTEPAPRRAPDASKRYTPKKKIPAKKRR